MHDPALWKRIAEHPFDAPGGTAPFSVKLATAEGWPKAYTNQVIEEYRRFVYLTQVSDAQVTPSQAVDRAWHMHLTFTRDYWEVFCPKVLGKPLHHEPCAGEEEMPRYRAQFAATRALYLCEFGGPAPSDIWDRRVNWKSITTGGGVGVVGAVLLAWVTLGLGPGGVLPGLVALGLMVAGWGFAVVNLPQLAGHESGKAKAGVSVGCGGGSGCGGGCGG